jgi:hypothetical protein
MDNGGCDNCLNSPLGQAEALARIQKLAFDYVQEKKVPVAILRTPEGFSFSEIISGPIVEVLLYNPPDATG